MPKMLRLKELLFLMSEPPAPMPKLMFCSGPLVATNGLRALSEPARTPEYTYVRIGPNPGCVTILFDVDRRLDAWNSQHDDLFVLTRTDAHLLENMSLEAGKLGLNRVAARLERIDGRKPAINGQCRDRR